MLFFLEIYGIFFKPNYFETFKITQFFYPEFSFPIFLLYSIAKFKYSQRYNRSITISVYIYIYISIKISYGQYPIYIRNFVIK